MTQTIKESDVSEGVEPCPFCGGEAEYIANPFHGGAKNMVSCKRCGAQAFWRKWNTRVSPPLPSPGVERPSEMLSSIHFLRELVRHDEPIESTMIRVGLLRELLDVAEAALSALPLDGGGCG
jgi:hypothetical protein